MNYSEKAAYSPEFFAGQAGGSRRSAEIVVPLLVDLLKPRSVLDVGCGVGTWLAEFAEAGVPNCFGVDGPWVDRKEFALAPSQLTHFDFANAPQPFALRLAQKHFDLVTSFEFLEHVSAERAPALVAMLASLTDTLVISAALPGQGGTGHINEQWIDYWANLLAPHGFKPLDVIRFIIWDDERIEPWYRQNTIAFFRGNPPLRVMELAESVMAARMSDPIRLIHPDILQNATDRVVREKALSGLPRRLAKRLIGQKLVHLVKRTMPSLARAN